MERSAYAAQLNADLPPSYASVVSMQSSSTSSLARIDRSVGDKFEEPPPYSTVININTQEQNAQEASSVLNMSFAALTKKDDAISASSPAVATVISGSASASSRMESSR